MSATAGSVSAVRLKSGLMARARSVKSRTAPDTPATSTMVEVLSGSGATGNSRSPESRRLIRLVIRSVTPGQASRRSRNRGPAVTTCSKLSRTRSRRLSASTSIRRSRSDSVPMSRSPSAPAMVSRTRSGLAIGARLTKATPSRKSSLDLGRGSDRQPRLADATGAGQGQQPNIRITQQCDNGGQLLVARNQARQRVRQRSTRAAVSGADSMNSGEESWRSGGWAAGMKDLTLMVARTQWLPSVTEHVGSVNSAGRGSQ